MNASAAARAQLAAYPSATLVAGEAIAAHARDDGFRDDGFAVSITGGGGLEATKLVLAFGVSDVLLDLVGLAERWGTSVLQCPYCYGFGLPGSDLTGVLDWAA